MVSLSAGDGKWILYPMTSSYYPLVGDLCRGDIWIIHIPWSNWFNAKNSGYNPLTNHLTNSNAHQGFVGAVDNDNHAG